MEKTVVRHYRDLLVWQKAMALTVEVYRLTEKLPKHELYGLVGQMRRAAVSVPPNIAEGHARDSTKEYLHHVSFAIGSLAELETQLQLCVDLRYCLHEDVTPSIAGCDEVGRMLHALQGSLLKKV